MINNPGAINQGERAHNEARLKGYGLNEIPPCGRLQERDTGLPEVQVSLIALAEAGCFPRLRSGVY